MFVSHGLFEPAVVDYIFVCVQEGQVRINKNTYKSLFGTLCFKIYVALLRPGEETYIWTRDNLPYQAEGWKGEIWSNYCPVNR